MDPRIFASQRIDVDCRPLKSCSCASLAMVSDQDGARALSTLRDLPDYCKWVFDLQEKACSFRRNSNFNHFTGISVCILNVWLNHHRGILMYPMMCWGKVGSIHGNGPKFPSQQVFTRYSVVSPDSLQSLHSKIKSFYKSFPQEAPHFPLLPSKMLYQLKSLLVALPVRSSPHEPYQSWMSATSCTGLQNPQFSTSLRCNTLALAGSLLLSS